MKKYPRVIKYADIDFYISKTGQSILVIDNNSKFYNKGYYMYKNNKEFWI